ncbi:MAG: KUP system potassium uptake [Beijerinckiaceae bacterium]|nr:MAG: KUP system potassium uptake [Beijerinckiaceae bacterium]
MEKSGMSDLPSMNGANTDYTGHEIAPKGFKRTLAMAVGSVGVVYGDIGTSPLYALKESLHHAAKDGLTRAEVIGIVSLLLWAIMIVVTVKYVIFIMRADNKGEGGTLSLMALAQKAFGRRSMPIFLLGVLGAALFYGDSIITPAMTVLSAVEGLKLVTPVFADQWNVIMLSVAILLALFMVQNKGTASVANFFGPIMVIWFSVLALLGAVHISDDYGILAAFNPYYAGAFMLNHGVIGLLVLGSVFLAVTGAEALYADMGHFGRFPIRLAWLTFVFPALAINYLGQGSFILKHLDDPKMIADPFFLMAPDWALLPLVILSTLAAIIASQAVITGAFSLTQQAVQLGLLPRIEIRHTSETQLGQIYIPQVNRLLAIGVFALVFLFKNSSALGSAYGIAVTGAMLADTGLFFIVALLVWKWPPWRVALFGIPFLMIDLVFFGANCLKIPEGAYMPLLFGALLMLMMWTWVRGTRIVYEKSRRDSVPLSDLIKMLEKSKPVRVAGTAVFLTSDPDTAPGALLHNLKHNKVLHKRNIMMTINTVPMPRVPESERLVIDDLSEDVKRIIVKVGYMESPRVPHFLALARRRGLDFDIMQTSFFLGKRTIKAAATSGMPLWQDNLFIFLSRTAANATDFFHIPTGRVVELGAQVTV